MEYRNRYEIDAGDYLKFLLQFDLNESDKELLDLFSNLYGYETNHSSPTEYVKYMKNNVTLVDLNVDSSEFINKALPRIFELGINRYLDDLNSVNGYFGSKGFRCCFDNNYGDYIIVPEDLMSLILGTYAKMRKQFDDSVSLSSDMDKACYVLSKTIVLEDRIESALAFYYEDELDNYIKTSYDRTNIQDMITITTDEWSYITRVTDKLYPNLDVGNNCYYVFNILDYLHLTKNQLNDFNYKVINNSLSNLVKNIIIKSIDEYSYENRQAVIDLLKEDRPVLDDINKLIGVDVL